jgi:hydroxymethylpyrimidine kinase/phosphomethylpyrimidine kinase
VVLTIAGFDPSGGAGIMADIRAFTFFGCTPVAAVTSLTVQNSHSMSGATHQAAEMVRAQIMSVLAENSIAAAKTGMLPTRAIVGAIVELVRDGILPAPVIDPVMRSSSGYDLITADAWDSLLRGLMPLARVITPNIPEAERITGAQISSEDEMRRAANQIRELGARAVLIKGGHLGERKSEVRGQRSAVGDQRSAVSDQRAERGRSPTVREGSHQAIDLLDDEGEVTIFRGDWIEGPPLRGTGCMLSAGITACLAKGMSLRESVAAAKHFVAGARSAQRAKGKEQSAQS